MERGSSRHTSGYDGTDRPDVRSRAGKEGSGGASLPPATLRLMALHLFPGFVIEGVYHPLSQEIRVLS